MPGLLGFLFDGLGLHYECTCSSYPMGELCFVSSKSNTFFTFLKKKLQTLCWVQEGQLSSWDV